MFPRPRIAVLDDYQNAAREFVDWSRFEDRAEMTVFNDHITDTAAVIERLRPFSVICVMRERTPLTREILSQLTRLKLICSTAGRNASIDMEAAKELGIAVAHTGYTSHGASELTWAAILGLVRQIPAEVASVQAGGWQKTVGGDLEDRILGIVGLGNLGKRVAAVGKAFGMEVIAWSRNITPERADAAGVRMVAKDDLFRLADVVTVHVVLSPQSHHMIGAHELGLMKPTAYFINTSRGPLVDEAALIEVLRARKIAGAALDVFETEPLPGDHPFRTLPNVLATPHIGFVTRSTYEIFFRDTVANIEAWLKTQDG
ncbi:MAG TPA: D-2-hydroxyacid dehydrogenase family protein [Magnetospirillaceae bacterium]|jgi:phosphoglycerate dehydrogenase-like enzyme